MNSTEKYLKENQRIHSLRKTYEQSANPKKVYIDSVLGLLKKNLFEVAKCMLRYPIEVIRGFSGLRETKRIRGSRHGSKAIVIGNGPSQGYLSSDMLNQFSKSGGETICVNYWNLNQSLASHVPTWLVFSDPETFHNNSESHKSRTLIDYLKRNPSIKIAAPWWLNKEMKMLGLENPIFTFIDCEVALLKNIHPLFPRGYLSMTLYKALAWALNIGYKEIGVIGMDNAYARSIYCDQNNHVINLETHAGGDDYICDQSSLYPSMAAIIQDIFYLFKDLDCFPTENIVNLDPFSMTDRFRKISLDNFLS